MSILTLRPFVALDRQPVSALISRSIDTLPAPYLDSHRQGMKDFFTPDSLTTLCKERDIFVVESRFTPIATASYADGTLYAVFTDPQFERLGAASLLVSFIKAHAALKGLTTLKVLASVSAQSFYEKHGFKVNSSAATSVGPGLHMSCSLPKLSLPPRHCYYLAAHTEHVHVKTETLYLCKGVPHDHSQRCCLEHSFHVSPHVGCILR